VLKYVGCSSNIVGPAVPLASAAVTAVSEGYVPVGPTVYVPPASGEHARVVCVPVKGAAVL
jgi:hypothetical protein